MNTEEIQQSALGAIILESDTIYSIEGEIKEEWFTVPEYKAMCKVILSLYQKNEPIDILTVTQEAKRLNLLEECGGAYNITLVTDRIKSAQNTAYYLGILKAYYYKDISSVLADQIKVKASQNDTGLDELIEAFYGASMKLSEAIESAKGMQHTSEIAKSNMEEMEAKVKAYREGTPSGIPTGDKTFDDYTGGFQKPDLMILAARPAMGKTALMLKWAKGVAENGGASIIFSLEMSKSQLLNRMAQDVASIEGGQMKLGNLSNEELTKYLDALAYLSGLNIYIDDQPGVTAMQVAARTKKHQRLMKAKGIELRGMFVDYLQLMKGDKGFKGNREQEISLISRTLKEIAKDREIPVIALSQLSRAVETRGGDKRPQLSDLRESGSIEQDADMVMFLYRPEYYGIMEDEEGNSTEGRADLIISKFRNGGLTDLHYKQEFKYMRFTAWSNEIVIGIAPQQKADDYRIKPSADTSVFDALDSNF